MATKAKLDPDVVSPDVLAAWLGVSRRLVDDLARQGRVKRAGRGAFHLRESVSLYCGYIREAAAGRSVRPEAERLAAARASLAEAKAGAMAGKLVSVHDVEATWGGMLRTIRAGVLAAPSRCGSRLPHLSASDVGVIETELRDVLAGLADDGCAAPNPSV